MDDCNAKHFSLESLTAFQIHLLYNYNKHTKTHTYNYECATLADDDAHTHAPQNALSNPNNSTICQPTNYQANEWPDRAAVARI